MIDLLSKAVDETLHGAWGDPNDIFGMREINKSRSNAETEIVEEDDEINDASLIKNFNITTKFNSENDDDFDDFDSVDSVDANNADAVKVKIFLFLRTISLVYFNFCCIVS